MRPVDEVALAFFGTDGTANPLAEAAAAQAAAGGEVDESEM